MRMIYQARRPHNESPRWPTAAVIAVALGVGLLALALGCQPAQDNNGRGDADGVGSGEGVSERTVASGCPLVVTTSAYTAFLDLAQEVKSAGTFGDAAAGRLAAHPIYTRWVRSFESPQVTAHTLDSWVARAFLGRSYELPDQQRVPFPGTYASLEYDFDRAGEIIAELNRFNTAETGCRALDLLDGFVRPGRLPDTLRVDFLAGNVEIRRFDNHAMVDVGLALALGQTQLAHLLASVLYQDVEFIPGSHPKDTSGAAAVYNTWRVVLNGGIAAWLEDLPNLYFGNDHPRLKNANPVPEPIFARAARTLADLDPLLTRLLADPESLARQGTELNKYLIGSQAYQAVGLAMVTLIDRRLGVARLQQSCHAVSDFLDAYQEAAALNPESPTGPRGRIPFYLESLRPLPPQTYPALRQLLVEQEEQN